MQYDEITLTNTMSGKTVLIAVQGEGRGHMTQALTLYHLLKFEGKEVCCVLVGGNPARSQPDFLRKQIPVPVVQVYSPFFVRRGDRGISVPATVAQLIWRIPDLFRSLKILHKLVQFHRPALIIQCYEPLVALYRLTHAFPGKILAIAHQYAFLHESFRFPKGHLLSRWLLKKYTKFTSFGADRVLAISLYPMDSSRMKQLQIIPPIVRPELLEMHPEQQSYMLVYLVNAGYLKDIVAWSQAHPEVGIHCFTDTTRINIKPREPLFSSSSMTVHALDGQLFLQYLKGCRVLVSTAGFETVCEAVYLGKTCLVVPVEGHFEQFCNAQDAASIGVVSAARFDLDTAWGLVDDDPEMNQHFRNWVISCPDLIRQVFRELLPNEIVFSSELSRRMQVIPGGVQQAVEQIIPVAGDIRQSLG
jgi:uncharacterized protein (TIGR00661 family)